MKNNLTEQNNVTLKYSRASEIEPKEVQWLWYPYIPYGKVTLVQGDPGDGKSKLMLAIAALLSKGEPLPFTDEEESAELQLIQDDFAAFDEETAPEDDGGILNLLSPFTKITLPEIMSGDSFPREVPLTITTPDMAKILTELHYEEYDSAEKLAEDLAAVLKKGGWPERTVTVNVTVQKDGETFHAGENPEAYFAFYGGLAELYMQEYTALLEQVGGMLGGEKE